MGVGSVAGADGLAPSAMTYQNAVVLVTNNYVYWAPQAWHGGSKSEESHEELVGAGDYISFYDKEGFWSQYYSS